jgi:uncharacterized protein YcfL
MKKHLILLAVAALLLASCSAKDNARLNAAIDIADAVVEVSAPAEEPAE